MTNFIWEYRCEITELCKSHIHFVWHNLDCLLIARFHTHDQQKETAETSGMILHTRPQQEETTKTNE